MYEEFYNLKSEPFRLSPDHRFCYNHSSYTKAKAYMHYAFKRAEGFVMITGSPGTGKTTLVNDLIASLSNQHAKVGMLVCTQLEAEDLLRMVADAFGIPSDTDQKSMLLQRLTKLFKLCYASGRRALLIIDEAQDLSQSALEELRLLTNLMINNQPLLQIFLLGQEELNEIIHHPRMEQVHQRIVAACHLRPLDQQDTKAYIKHRLTQVGWRGDPAISEAVYPVIHKFSNGIPRRINMLCSRLFLHGCVEEKHKLGIADARIVLEEIKQEQLTSKEIPTDIDFDADDFFEPLDFSKVEPITAAKKKTNPALNQQNIPPSQRGNPPDMHANTTLALKKKGEYLKDSSNKLFVNGKYIGPESRVGQRRQGKDRREVVRFDPIGSGERRKTPGRRKEDIVSFMSSRRIWGAD